MFENMKSLLRKDFDKVDNNKLYPLLRWSSASVSDLKHCNAVNKYYFLIPSEISKAYLMYGLKASNMLKYPKANKDNDIRFTILKPYIKSVYNFSDREINVNINNIKHLINNQDYIHFLNNSCGIENKELKKLGIKINKLKITKPEIEKVKEHNFW